MQLEIIVENTERNLLEKLRKKIKRAERALRKQQSRVNDLFHEQEKVQKTLAFGLGGGKLAGKAKAYGKIQEHVKKTLDTIMKKPIKELGNSLVQSVTTPRQLVDGAIVDASRQAGSGLPGASKIHQSIVGRTHAKSSGLSHGRAKKHMSNRAIDHSEGSVINHKQPDAAAHNGLSSKTLNKMVAKEALTKLKNNSARWGGSSFQHAAEEMGLDPHGAFKRYANAPDLASKVHSLHEIYTQLKNAQTYPALSSLLKQSKVGKEMRSTFDKLALTTEPEGRAVLADLISRHPNSLPEPPILQSYADQQTKVA